MVEAKDIIPILVIGGLILLGSRARAPEEAVPPPPPPEEKPPVPPPPPYPPILGEELPPPEEKPPVPPPEEVQPAPPYPIEFLLPPRRVEVMPMAVPPPPPPPEEPRVIGETEFYIFEERRFPQPQPPLEILETVPIPVREWEIVTDVYPLGSEEVTIAISDIRTPKIRLVSYRAPPGYVVTGWGSSGSWDTGDYQAWLTIGVKQLYGW